MVVKSIAVKQADIGHLSDMRILVHYPEHGKVKPRFEWLMITGSYLWLACFRRGSNPIKLTSVRSSLLPVITGNIKIAHPPMK